MDLENCQGLSRILQQNGVLLDELEFDSRYSRAQIVNLTDFLELDFTLVSKRVFIECGKYMLRGRDNKIIPDYKIPLD